MFRITAIRHAWPEKAGFILDRPFGHPQYTFLHFFGSVELLLDGRTVTVPPHTCLLYRPGTPQLFRSRGVLVHDWLHIEGNPEPLLRRYGIPANTLLYPVGAEFITDVVREMETEFSAQREGGDRLLSLKTEELFLKLSRACHGTTDVHLDTPTEERLQELRREVFLSLRHPWTVGEMAARINLSQSRFFSVYRAFYGSSPTDDLIRARIDAAKNELAFGPHAVARIAEDLGYNNVTHFIRQFKAITGTSPLRYRKRETAGPSSES